jgi:mono/diheme cytochrome c family protein
MTALYAVANMDTLGWIQGRPAPALESNAEYDAAGLVNKLIDHGANPNPRLKRAMLKRHHDFQQERILTEGATPLMRAARYGDAKLVRVLLERGADPTLTTKDGTNALMFAAGVNLAAVRDDQGLTALHGAVQRGQGSGNGSGEKVIALLVERGAKLDIKDKRGRTPLEMARAGEGQILNRVEDSGPAARLLARLGGDTATVAYGAPAPKPAEAPSQTKLDLWEGVYSTAQADRGKASYKVFCQACHGENLGGGLDPSARAPALIGDHLLSRKDLNNVFTYIRDWMPADDRGTLQEHTVIDIVSYILQRNSFPSGAEELQANAQALKQMLLVKKPQ